MSRIMSSLNSMPSNKLNKSGESKDSSKDLLNEDYVNNLTTVIELNVGGVYYATTLTTLVCENDSLFSQLFDSNTNNVSSSSSSQIANSLNMIKIRDSKNKLFFDRDGLLFRYVLDYLRNKSLILPENFNEKRRLRREAEYFRLNNMVKAIDDYDYETTLNLSFNALQARQYQGAHNMAATPLNIDFEKEKTSLSLSNSTILPPINNKGKRSSSGFIVIGYRGTFAFGREGLSDVKFRKISRILVCGRVQLCREVFNDTLNESRDPDHGVSERYTSRFFLKHTFLEQAFDTLNECGFYLVGTCATGTNAPIDQFNKAANDSEESRWLHYNEFVFFRA